jgi:hypothetical protein
VAIQDVSPQMLKQLLEPCLAWCRKSRSVEESGLRYRSDELRLAASAVFPASCHTTYSNQMADSMLRFRAVRTGLLQPGDISIEQSDYEVRSNRSLLLTDWRKSLFDGALSAETGGFFDDDGMPPWDTWLAILPIEESVERFCLLSWIPADEFIGVNCAIELDAAQSLSWIALDSSGSASLCGWGRGRRNGDAAKQ